MPDLLRELVAIVIDLTRSPSRGRDLGILLRQRMATRLVPLVFAGCAPEKVAGVRELIPDAAFSDWEEIAVALRRAIPRPTAQPVVHASAFAAYAGRPLVRRLGIRSGMRVAVVGPPSGLTATLEPLPEGVQLTSRLGPASDLILWFVRRPADFKRKLPRMSNGVGMHTFGSHGRREAPPSGAISRNRPSGPRVWRLDWWTTRSAPSIRPGPRSCSGGGR